MADFLDEVFAAPAEALPEPVVEPTPEPVIEQAPEPAPEPEPQPEPAPQPEPVVQQDHTVPLAKFLDTRDENKELKRRLAEMEAQRQPATRPDPFDDPEGYAAHTEQLIDQRLSEQRFQMSDLMARQVHGAEVVEKAVPWALEKAQKDPVFAAAYMRDPNPIDWIVRQHKRDSIVSQLPEDVSSLDELIEREIAKRGLSAAPAAQPIPAAAVPQQAPKPAAPPRSIASDAPASIPTVVDPNADFMSIFTKR